MTRREQPRSRYEMSELKALIRYGAAQANERCSRQALFGCGFAAMVIVCLQLN